MIKRPVLLTLCFALWSATSLANDLVIYNAHLHLGPGKAPVKNATIVINDGEIAEISHDKSRKSVVKIDAKGRSVTAGLWNSHVHLTDPKLKTDTQVVLTKQFLKYGFTSVVDTGSDLSITHKLIQSIERGEITGPDIITASGSFVYTDGTPSYLPEIKLPEISAPSQAAHAVERVLASGAQGIKIFSGSFISPTETIHLPPDVISAITSAAHEKNAFVIAHPTDKTGLENAIRNGVDILAHTAPTAGALSTDNLNTLIDKQVALIPTLKLWSWELGRLNLPSAAIESTQDIAIGQLTAVHEAGGTILFGTDVGYMTDHDPAKEYRLMARAGMNFSAILESLTTAPAQKFSSNSGRVEVGQPADLVIYKTSPETHSSFELVDITIKAGTVVYSANDE